MRGRRFRLLAALLAAVSLVAASGCTGASSNEHASGQLKLLTGLPRPDGTAFGRLGEALPSGTPGEGLIAILTASDKDGRGHPVTPANRFSSEARQVAVIVHVGALAHPAALAIDWYATDAAGKEILLSERKIHVDGNAWAWSVGHAHQPVRPGLYEAVARLDGSEMATWFQVGDLQPPASIRDAASAGVEGMGALDLMDQQAQGEWDEWNDGAAPDQPVPNQGGSPHGCDLDFGGEAVGTSVQAWAEVGLPEDDCGRVTIAAAVSGDPVQQASGDNRASAFIDPCDLTGGSDLPGTVVHLVSRAERSGQTKTARVELTDDELPPFVEGAPAPPDGSLVHPGDTITIRLGAIEYATGIHKLDAIANGVPFASWVSPNDQPKACDPFGHIKVATLTYLVPKHPPPIVEILVRAENFTGRFGWAAWHFPTKGTSWAGRATADLSQKVPSGTQTAHAEVTVTLFEDADGNITGELDGTQKQKLDLTTCPSVTTAPGHIHAEVTGTHEGDTVSLELGRVDFTPPDMTPCPEGGEPGKMGSLVNPIEPAVGKALSAIIRQSDGSFRAEASSTGGVTYPYEVTFSIELKPTP